MSESRCGRGRIFACVVLLVGVAVGCGGDDVRSRGDGGATDPGPIDSSDANAGENGLPSRPWPQGTTCFPVPKRATSQRVTLVPAFPKVWSIGKYPKAPLALLQHPSEDDEWFLATQDGLIFSFSESGNPRKRIALDIGSRMWRGDRESGLFSAALDPQFPTRPYIFIVYTAPINGAGGLSSRLSRFSLAPGGRDFDPGSEQIVLDVPQGHASHSGNHIEFGPDGYLYFSLGDGNGSRGGDPDQNGQNPRSLPAALLRLDVSALGSSSGAEKPYAIPKDNPFAQSGAGAPEVYAFGLRNPWRFSVDPIDGRIFVGDVGEHGQEEINLIEPGANYGWPIFEGTRCVNPALCANSAHLKPPVMTYPTKSGQAVVGGYLYRGQSIPHLKGRYVYGDFGSGSIFSMSLRPDGTWESHKEIESGRWLLSFGRRRDGEIFVIKSDIWLLAPLPLGDPQHPPPRWLSETGCMDTQDPRKPGPDLVPFEVQNPLYSDGARKQRFLYVPEGARASISDDGDVSFPVGSVLVKHFSFGETPHETRLLVHHQDGWQGYSYEWTEDGTNAVLLESGKTRSLTGDLRWDYPGRAECFQCHTESAGITLGPGFIQMGLGKLYELVERGSVDPAELASKQAHFPRPLVPPESGRVSDRARSYLHVNCSHCHRSRAGASRVALDLRASVRLEDTGLCDLPKTWPPNPEANGLRILAPADPARSIILARLRAESFLRMPPVGSRVIDEAGAALIQEWIMEMKDCSDPSL